MTGTEHHFTERELLQLASVQGMTAASLRRIVEHFRDAAALRRATPAAFAALRVRNPAWDALRDFVAYDNYAAQQLAVAAKHGARMVTIWHDEYPAALREIYNPPAFLFVRGTLTEADRQAVAIVGTRSMTDYGHRMAETFARYFAERGVTVVSGLARGVDTAAHSATLRHHGRTIAVVASGLDAIQPHMAASLAGRIAQEGAVVSEYRMGTRALPSYFPQRNRIISGLARGTVVIESAVDGGAMITAGFAIDQNRDVFAVPARVGDVRSAGCNKLIRECRATLVEHPKDVLVALGIVDEMPVRAAPEPPADLSMFERTVLECLTDEPRHIDDIAERSSFAPHDVLVNLLTLELKGLVRQMAGKMFLRER